MTLPGLLSGAKANASLVSPLRLVRGLAADGFGEGFTGFALVVVVVRVGVFVVVFGVGAAVVVVVLVVLAGVVVDVVLAARGVCAAPAQALSARQAATNETVCRMVTEGNPDRR